MEPAAFGFGALLKQYRMLASLTQEGLADRAGLSVRAISDLERGVSRAPRYDTLDRLALAMTLSPEQRGALFAAARPSLAVADASGRATRPPPLQTMQPVPAAAPTLLPLPVPPTPVVGREQEIARAVGLMRGSAAQGPVRLLTLTGPAGVGKTRLALQIADELRDHMADGLAFVDLAPVRDPRLVPQIVAESLGLGGEAGLPVNAQVQAFLLDKQFLLLLDNFEQVLDAADFVGNLIANCRQLRVLVTSRVSLRLRAEHQLVLAPLSMESASMLFYLRAQAQGRALSSDRGTLEQVEAICERVDRLPLAIELAAAYVKALSLPLLLERLEERLPLLRDGARDLPERHRTMYEAIAWSYDLLVPGQQRIFRALAVFAGGCTLSAAEAICSIDGNGAPDASGAVSGTGSTDETGAVDEVITGIIALVDASLVQSEVAGDGMARFTLLEVIREYALEQLRALGEEAQCFRRYAAYYAQLAEEAERVEPGYRVRETQLQREVANGRAALQWAYEEREVALGLRLATSLGPFWFRHGQIEEAGVWVERMLDLDTTLGVEAAPPVVRGRALHAASRRAMTLGMSERAAALAMEAVALAEQTGDQANMSRVLAVLGSIALEGDRVAEAVDYFTKSQAAAVRAGDTRGRALAGLNIGEIARKQGNFERAEAVLEESLSLMRAGDVTWAIADTVTLLGHVARQLGNHEQARLRYRESLELYQGLGDVTHTAWCLEGVAALLCAEQFYGHATRLCAAAAALRAAARTPLPPAEQEDFDRVVRSALAGLTDAGFEQEWRAGSDMGLSEAISYALHVLAAASPGIRQADGDNG